MPNNANLLNLVPRPYWQKNRSEMHPNKKIRVSDQRQAKDSLGLGVASAVRYLNRNRGYAKRSLGL